jgi:hypothetical protein
MATEGGGLKLPGVGHVSKRWLMIVGVVSVGSVGYFIYRRKQTAAAAAAAPAASDSTGATDPLTGDVAGSAQDTADLAAMQDGGGGIGTDGIGDYGGYLAASPAGAAIPGAGGFTTNAEWAQQAETDLGGLGITETALAAALGHYLTGSQLATGEQSLVDQAIAEEGYPPVSASSGYPPAMRTSATSTSGTGTTTGTTTGTGTSGLAGAGPISNLQPKSQTATSVTMGWNKSAGASGGYAWTLTGNGASKSGKTTRTSVTVTGLKKGTYNFSVQGLPGGAGDNYHVTIT